MGFLDDLGKSASDIGGAIGGVAKQATSILPGSMAIGLNGAGLPGMLAGAIGGEYIRNQTQGGGADKPATPGVDPNIAAIKDAQTNSAVNFRQNMPGFENDTYNQFRNQGLRGLATQMHNTTESMNSRGLGYGGLAAGAQAKNAAGFASNMAQSKEDIANQSENMANQLDADALNSGNLLRQTQQGIQDTIYNQALRDYQIRNNSMGQIMGGIGTGVGMGMARKA